MTPLPGPGRFRPLPPVHGSSRSRVLVGGFLTKKRKVLRAPLWAEEYGPRVRHLRSARAAGPERRGRWQSATLSGRKQSTSVRCHGSARSHCRHRARGRRPGRLPRARLSGRRMPLAGTRDSPAAEGPQPAGACDQRNPGETCGMSGRCRGHHFHPRVEFSLRHKITHQAPEPVKFHCTVHLHGRIRSARPNSRRVPVRGRPCSAGGRRDGPRDRPRRTQNG
jgi:hypothetical protein